MRVGRAWTWLAWAIVAVFVVSVAGTFVLGWRDGNFQDPLQTTSLLLAFAAFTGVGAVLVAHRPGNAIGWILAVAGLLATTGGAAEAYARSALLAGRHWPGGPVAAWWSGWTWFPTLALTLVGLPLLFPTGRPPTRRWRPVLWLAAIVGGAISLLAAIQPTIDVSDVGEIANPFALGPFGNPEESVTGGIFFAALILLILLAVVSLVLRFRRARGDERQQLKWFTYAAALLPLSMLVDGVPAGLGDLVFASVIALLPLSAGIAVLRHRLYDIDRLINRTLVYALLTALLAVVYSAIVLGGAQAFGGLGTRTPSWAVAGATLAVAALFQPARRRIQGTVDRRFDRRRYDAGRTIDGFSVRLRAQVDLGTLSAELLGVVEQTMQPANASLWLRPETEPRARP
jgi:hypothetical protein